MLISDNVVEKQLSDWLERMLRIQQVSASKPHLEIGCPDLSIYLSSQSL